VVTDHDRVRRESVLLDALWLEAQVSDSIRQPGRAYKRGSRARPVTRRQDWALEGVSSEWVDSIPVGGPHTSCDAGSPRR
jgi:hypothetical protein